MRLTRPWLFLPLAAVAALMVIVLLVSTWLLTSTSGSRWLLGQVSIPQNVRFELDDGSLLSGLEFSDLQLESDTITLSVERGELTLRPLGFLQGIVVQRIALENAVLEIDAGDGDQGASEPPDMAAWSAPVPLVLQDGQVSGLTMTVNELQDFVLDKVRLAGRWDQALTDLELDVESDWLALSAGGDLRLAGGKTQLVLDASIDGRRFDPGLPDDLQIDASTRGGLETIDLELTSTAMGLRASGTLVELLAQPLLEMDVALDRLDLPLGDEPMVDLSSITGALSLSPDHYRVQLAGGLVAPELGDLPEPIAWQASVSGDLAGNTANVNLEQLELTTGEGRLQAQGLVRLDETGGAPPQLELDLQWQSLQWPLRADVPDLTSDTGKGRLSGQPDDWQFEGQFALATPDYPAGRLDVSARGDTTAARFEMLQGTMLGGSVSGQGDVAWGDDTGSELLLNFDTLDLAAILPDWPAVVSGELAVSIRWEDELQALIKVAQLQGQLFDESLAFTGQLLWSPAGFEAREANLSAGTSTVLADGFLGQEWYGILELDLRLPGWLPQLAGGNWEGSVALDSRQDFPVVAADLVARKVALDDVAFDELTVQRNEDSEDELSLNVSGLELAGNLVDSLSLRLAANSRADNFAQQLFVDAQWSNWSVSANSSGDVLYGASIAETSWSGELDTLRVQRGDQALLSLASSAPLELGANLVAVRDACLDLTTGGSLCLAIEQQPGGGLEIAGNFQALSLAILELFSVDGLGSTQVLDGPFQWSMPKGASPQGAADLRLSSGNIYDATRDDFGIEVGAGSLGFNLENGALRNGRIDLPLPGAGVIRSAFEIDGVKLDGSGTLRGDLNITLENLQLFDELLDPVEELAGSLRLSMQLSGVTADPDFDGVFDLSGVSFTIPSLGTEVSELSLRGRVNRADRLTLRGTFESGEGSGSLTAEAVFEDWNDLRLDTRLQGSRLAVVRLPDLEADLSPDVRLAYGQGRWQVSGTAAIPSATITPLTIGVTRVDESADVVIMAGAPATIVERDSTRPLQIDGSIAVTLGDAIKVVMDKANLGLTGAVDLLWAGDLTPTAQGEVRINGDVTAWGPRLAISGGRVRWSGEPLNNPQLDVRAERDVFGNTLIRTAGVRIAGSARNPDIEAYTMPLTTSERAWAVLLTGSDVNFAQGVGAFDVGTYISPRIFLSYGISFFDSENVVGIRYDLRRGWGIKATSGQQDSGVDLSYTIED